MKFGIFTGGGDAPGLNGIIESVAKTLFGQGHRLLGIRDGFEGIFNKDSIEITPEMIQGLHAQAGTLLGTSNKSRVDGRETEFLEKYSALGLDGLIVAGGDGTFSALSRLGGKIPIVGVPKTIDNDIHGTEFTFGFDTACAVIADAVDALRATAHAHRRIMIVETMGRTAGWIALGAGLASMAEVILIPERPFNRKALIDYVRAQKEKGHRGMVMVVSEAARAQGEESSVAFKIKDSFQQERFGGIAERLARWIEKEVHWDARHVVPGHLQRSRAPTTTDRFLTVSMGALAARSAMKKDWGKAIVYKDGMIQTCPLEIIQQGAKVVPEDHRWVRLVQGLGHFI